MKNIFFASHHMPAKACFSRGDKSRFHRQIGDKSKVILIQTFIWREC